MGKSPETEYVVLQQEGDGNRFYVTGIVKAHSADQAVRKPKDDGVFVAIPKRSWSPQRVTTTQIPRTSVEPVEIPKRVTGTPSD